MLIGNSKNFWSKVIHTKDFWSGVIFVAVGVAALFFARGHAMGTAMRMGPAYFPAMLGILMTLIGIAVILRSVIRPGPPVGRFASGKLALVLGATAFFGLLMRRAGLPIAIILLVLLSAYASDRFRWPVALALALTLAVCSTVVFVRLLGIPLPIIGTWMEG